MLHTIIGPKGSGKTKKLITEINETVKTATGSVVCVERDKNLVYALNHRVRLVSAKECGVHNSERLMGLLTGLHAGNYDIKHIFIDNLYKIIGDDKRNCGEFIAWCAGFAKDNNLSITMTISDTAETAPVEAFKRSEGGAA